MVIVFEPVAVCSIRVFVGIRIHKYYPMNYPKFRISNVNILYFKVREILVVFVKLVLLALFLETT